MHEASRAFFFIDVDRHAARVMDICQLVFPEYLHRLGVDTLHNTLFCPPPPTVVQHTSNATIATSPTVPAPPPSLPSLRGTFWTRNMSYVNSPPPPTTERFDLLHHISAGGGGGREREGGEQGPKLETGRVKKDSFFLSFFLFCLSLSLLLPPLPLVASSVSIYSQIGSERERGQLAWWVFLKYVLRRPRHHLLQWATKYFVNTIFTKYLFYFIIEFA